MTTQTDRVRVSWVVAETAVPAAISEIEESDGAVKSEPVPFVPPPDEVEDYHDAQFDPLLVIASVVAVGFLLKRISDIWLDHKRPGGLIVDARGNELVIRPAPQIPRDSLLVLTTTESKMYTPDRKDDALSTLITLAKSCFN